KNEPHAGVDAEPLAPLKWWRARSGDIPDALCRTFTPAADPMRGSRHEDRAAVLLDLHRDVRAHGRHDRLLHRGDPAGVDGEPDGAHRRGGCRTRTESGPCPAR